MTKSERIFSILNKLDKSWSGTKGKITFCELVNLIAKNESLGDLEFSKAMDNYIEEHKIK